MPNLKSVRPPVIRDHEDQFQREVRSAVSNLDSPELRRVTVRNVVLGVTTVLVPHTFGKIPANWAIVDKNAQADVWRDTTQPVTADLFPLKASGTVTVSIQFWGQ